MLRYSRNAIIICALVVSGVQGTNITLGNVSTTNDVDNDGTAQRREDKMDSPFWIDVMNRILGRKSACYDNNGCFQIRGQFAYLRHIPEDPDSVSTIFYLQPSATVMKTMKKQRTGRTAGIRLLHSGPESLANAGFDPQRPTKILLHGYGDYGSGPTVAKLRNGLLKKDVNIITVDWEYGARGPNYFRAIAKGELVAKQISHLILSMVALSAKPKDIHLIGFSLGAQVAGFVGAEVKKKNMKIGRITGLDPASFSFEYAGLEADRRLDISDADFVEIVHTDASLMWSDGLGLLRPVGHVDYFPNGGRNQPGCNSSYFDAVLSQFSRALGICSHIRSVDLFLESMEGKCNFVGFPCPGLRSFSRNFIHGNCFSCVGNSCASIGHSNRKGKGTSLYLVTRDSPPYCGQQLRVSVNISSLTRRVQGSIVIQLNHGTSNTSFELNSSGFFTQMLGIINGGQELSAIAAALPNSVDPDRTPILNVTLIFRPVVTLFAPTNVILTRVSITSQESFRWYHCNANIILIANRPLKIQLNTTRCEI